MGTEHCGDGCMLMQATAIGSNRPRRLVVSRHGRAWGDEGRGCTCNTTHGMTRHAVGDCDQWQCENRQSGVLHMPAPLVHNCSARLSLDRLVPSANDEDDDYLSFAYFLLMLRCRGAFAGGWKPPGGGVWKPPGGWTRPTPPKPIGPRPRPGDSKPGPPGE